MLPTDMSDLEYDYIINDRHFEPEIRHRHAYKRLGIVHLIVGCSCFLLEIIGTVVNLGLNSTFGGLYVGPVLSLIGCLSLLAYSRNSRRFVIAAFVLDIIGIVIVMIGIVFIHIEIHSPATDAQPARRKLFQKVKCYIILAACCFEAILLIAQLTCLSSTLWCGNQDEQFDRVHLVLRSFPESGTITVDTPTEISAPIDNRIIYQTARSHASIEHM